MIGKLKSESGGISRREVLLVVLITLMVLFFAYQGMEYLLGQQALGDDGLRANTAESVAMIDSDAGMRCPVRDCPSPNGNCVHKAGEYYIGYFDDIQNTIVGSKPYGYNDSSHPKINGETYYGYPGTMVIRVMTGHGTIKLNWEAGKK